MLTDLQVIAVRLVNQYQGVVQAHREAADFYCREHEPFRVYEHVKASLAAEACARRIMRQHEINRADIGHGIA